MVSDVVASARYIKLEEREHGLIGNIDKAICDQGRYYLLDRDATQSLLVFDHNGKFVFGIDRRGKGPGEYEAPDDFVIEPDTKRIIILDSSQRKLLYYDSNGKFESESTIDFAAHSFAWIGPNTCLFYLYDMPFGQGHVLEHFGMVMLKSGEIAKKLLPYPESSNRFQFMPQAVFWSNMEALLFAPVFCDTVFQVASSVIIPKYSIDFGGTKLPGDFVMRAHETRADFHDELNSHGTLINNCFETPDHLYFQFSHQRMVITVFHSKLSGNTTTGKLIGNDVDGAPFAPPKMVCDDEFIGAIDAADFLEACERDPSKFSEDVLNMGRTLTDVSNPILVAYKLKTF
jgi:hypothetical protein